MSPRALQRAHLVPAVVFLAAVLVLAVQLLTPSPVVVSVGESGAEATTIGQYFTFGEVAVVTVAAAVCGGSGMYLLLHDRARAAATQPRRSRGPTDDRPRVAGDGGVTTAVRRSAVTGESDDEAVEERWQESLDRLAENEETLYELLVEADGELPQRTLVEETDLSKATVSRTLDSLEQRGLLERRRDGMGNTVLLT